MQMPDQAIVILFIVSIVSIVTYILAKRYNKERTKAIQSFAVQRGYRFIEKNACSIIQINSLRRLNLFVRLVIQLRIISPSPITAKTCHAAAGCRRLDGRATSKSRL